jgi:hypothetical protein
MKKFLCRYFLETNELLDNQIALKKDYEQNINRMGLKIEKGLFM